MVYGKLGGEGNRQRFDVRSTNSGDWGKIANILASNCGLGRTLNIGSGEGMLVHELLSLGIDAVGIDVCENVVQRANARMPGRFCASDILNLPYDDGAFNTVVSTGLLERMARGDIIAVLREFHRVSDRFVVLQLATTFDRDGGGQITNQGRAWWERQCFEAGFRKHPAYYRINQYENLEYDGPQIIIPLEKVPTDAIATYPLSALDKDRGLHMDMTRDTGDRSDAHIIRYQLAASFTRPGDRILDAACGLGYGSHVLAELSRAVRVLGVDASDYAVDYARLAFGQPGKVTFETGFLPQALRRFSPNSFDLIVSFETLEHVEDPSEVLADFHRVLAPGGRVIVSVPNDWSDESGEDPNPFHLHVYDFDKLARQISKDFIPDVAFQQIATQCKIATSGRRWERRPRKLRMLSPAESDRPDSEWWIMVGMKSPLGENGLGKASRASPGITYSNPWIERAMVHSGYRLANGESLAALSRAVLDSAPANSNDRFAALTVLAYRMLETSFAGRSELDGVIEEVRRTIGDLPGTPAGARWRISLTFVLAHLLQRRGELGLALDTFEACAQLDPLAFSVHLATKTAEAIFRAGILAIAGGQHERARSNWNLAFLLADRLLRTDIDQIVIDRTAPNLFDHGDGVREFVLAWDFIARSANAVALLASDGAIRPGDYDILMNSFTFKNERMLADLAETRLVLGARTMEASDRAVTIRALQEAVENRTDELITTRAELVQRTKVAEKLVAELQDRTAELVATRADLIERTEVVGRVASDLEARTAELVETRSLLVERTALIENLIAELQKKTLELATRRSGVAQRNEAIGRLAADPSDEAAGLTATKGDLHNTIV